VVNILTVDEAARVVIVDSTDERLADVLPQVDAYIQQATGRDWTQDNPIRIEAKSAARLQLALTYDLGAMQPSQLNILRSGLICALTQLESMAFELQAIDNVNSAMYEEDMQFYLEVGALGLNLINYNRLIHAGKYNVARAILTGRPLNGYTDVSAIQVAFDAAVKAVLPQ
jgi:hypothetical protein